MTLSRLPVWFKIIGTEVTGSPIEKTTDSTTSVTTTVVPRVRLNIPIYLGRLIL